MDTFNFYGWFTNHFLNNIPPKRPVVLILDGHSSHVDLSLFEYAASQGVILFKLPPHTSHVLQPCYRGYFKCIEKCWILELAIWAFENPGAFVTKRNFGFVFTKAFDLATGSAIIKTSFSTAGVWPVNRGAIKATALAPSSIYL